MTREARTETREEDLAPRKRRVPLGKHRQRLRVDPSSIPKGKVARWINDEGSRLQDALEAGYAFLDDPTIQVGEQAENQRDKMVGKVRTRVGTDRQEQPMYGYLMVIDQQLYDADQRDKQAGLDVVEEAIRGGIDKEGAPGRDGRYIPRGPPNTIETGLARGPNKETE